MGEDIRDAQGGPDATLALADRVAEASRMLGAFGLARESTGHVSARTMPERMLMRCRGPEEAGLVFTEASCVREVGLDGQFCSAEDAERYRIPSEWPIHTELYAARPDIMAVVHGHPAAIVTCMAAGLELMPIFGAYDPPAAMLAVGGIPVFPRATLVSRQEDGQELARILGDRPVCLMRGHGMVAVGRTVEEATLRAIRLEALAQMTLEIARAGGTPRPIPQDEIDFFVELMGHDDGSRAGWVWRHYQRLLARAQGEPRHG